jgi:hypothetical protein
MKLFLVFSLICLVNVHNSQFNTIKSSMYYTTVITFGDSSNDTGNGYRISSHTWPPSPIFNSNGGYADGLLRNQIFTQQLLSNVILQDFSYDGETANSQLVQWVTILI